MLSFEASSLNLDHKPTQAEYIRCKVQCKVNWDPIIATTVSKEHFFANDCELGCYFQVTGIEEGSVSLKHMSYDPLRPSVACLRAWKHALFNDWASLDPTVTESDPLPTWFTSLDNHLEMDASEAEIVLSWCLGEDPPVDSEIPERRKLAEMYSIIPPSGQGTPTTVPANNAVDGTPAAVSSRMQEFPEINPAIVVDIATGSVSSESAIYTDPVATITPGSSSSSITNGGGNVYVSNQIQATEDATPTLGQPPINETKPKPKPSPAPQEPQDSTTSNSTPATSPGGDGNGELLPSPDSGSDSDSSSSDGGNNTKPVKPSPSPKPDKNDPNDMSSTTAGGDDTDGNSSPPSTDSTIDEGNANNDTQGGNNNDTTNGSEVENPDQETSNSTTPSSDSSSSQIDFGNGEEETTTTTTDSSNTMYESIDPEDYATPGNYKPVIIIPAFTVVNPNVEGSAASGGDGAVMADLDAEHLLQAGSGSDSEVVDNEAVIATEELATLELDGESVDGETVAVLQVAMSTSSSPPTIFSSSIALLLTAVMLLGV